MFVKKAKRTIQKPFYNYLPDVLTQIIKVMMKTKQTRFFFFDRRPFCVFRALERALVKII